jgi:hypothetical protein
MTGFFTRCCRSNSLLGALVVVWSALLLPFAARADGIEIREATFVVAESGYVIEADIEISLTPTLEDVLNKGVSLYFLLEFELIRPRWYWFNEKIIDTQLQYRLSYNALTRQYRVGVGSFYQNFASLTGALEFMSRVRRRAELEPGAVRKDAAYTAALRLRLDTSQLPKPFQLSALGSREWNLGSDWYRWTLGP